MGEVAARPTSGLMPDLGFLPCFNLREGVEEERKERGLCCSIERLFVQTAPCYQKAGEITEDGWDPRKLGLRDSGGCGGARL